MMTAQERGDYWHKQYVDIARTRKHRYYIILQEKNHIIKTGPYYTEDERDAEATRMMQHQGNGYGIFWASVDEDGLLEVGSYLEEEIQEALGVTKS